MHLNELKQKKINELMTIAEQLKIEDAIILKRHELIFSILKALDGNNSHIWAHGVLEVLTDGFGFLRSCDYGYLPGCDDIYVPKKLIKKYFLRTGDTIKGRIVAPKGGHRYERKRKSGSLIKHF